jgi:DNA-binding GntR family transcriptional regulator
MSLDDDPALARQRASGEAEIAVRRVDRAQPSPAKITRAEELRLQLADEIVRGALPPGAALDETDIARRFSVSRTPVREALRQLVASGLVDAQAHRGAVVARPSVKRLTGMFEAMAELEAICAGLAAERMSPTERHRLEAVHEELRVLSHAGNPERFHEVNERFHNAIYAGAHNDYIAETTLATRVRVQPFRRAQFRNLGRLAKSHAEHDRVVVAILRGDKAGAANAMRAHIELVRGEYEIYTAAASAI